MKKVHTKVVENIDELWSILHHHLEKGTYIYRGISNSEFSLTPSIHRINQNVITNPYTKSYLEFMGSPDTHTYKKHCNFMYTMMSSFASHANLNGLPILMDPLYKKMINSSENSIEGLSRLNFLSPSKNGYSTYPTENYLDLMAVCQHYGLPTELIDFTVNPYTALYFSIRDLLYKYNNSKINEYIYNGNMALWFVNYDYLKNKLENSTNFPLRTYVSVYANNPNLNSQKGVFLYWLHQVRSLDIVNRKPLNELYENSDIFNKDVFSKLVIPNRFICDIYKVLVRFNHVADSLFAGYTGVELRMREDILIKSIEIDIAIAKDMHAELLRKKGS